MLYALTTVVSIFGNSVVCYVAFRLRSHSKTYLLLGNMAISDLISGLVIPLQWVFCSTAILDKNERTCSIFKSLQVVSYFISTFTMALIAIDRFGQKGGGLDLEAHKEWPPLPCSFHLIIDLWYSATHSPLAFALHGRLHSSGFCRPCSTYPHSLRCVSRNTSPPAAWSAVASSLKPISFRPSRFVVFVFRWYCSPSI